MNSPMEETVKKAMEPEEPEEISGSAETEPIDWERISQLRVTRTVLEAFSNLEITAVYLLRGNRRKDARKKFLGHGSRRMMAEAESPFVLDKPNPLVQLIRNHPEGLNRYREDALVVIEESIAKNELVSRETHSGLIQMTVPVRFKGQIVGVLRVGDFFPGKADDLTVAKLVEKLNYMGTSEGKLSDTVKKAPFFSSEKIAVIGNLLEMLSQEISSYIEETTREEKATGDIEQFNYQGLITKNPIILDIIRQIKLIGASDSSVIIYGESGTGKELISKLIHDHSNRKEKPLVTINCAALTETILEAELFGYKKGAFTGAVADKKGLFEVADTGTIFLDEVGEMSLSLQVKILRLIQEGTFLILDGHERNHVEVRLVSGTQRSLSKMI